MEGGDRGSLESTGTPTTSITIRYSHTVVEVAGVPVSLKQDSTGVRPPREVKDGE